MIITPEIVAGGTPVSSTPRPVLLQEYEAQIESALLILGVAFARIEEDGLFRESGHEHFVSYCVDRWKVHTSITDQWIRAMRVNAMLWPPRG